MTVQTETSLLKELIRRDVKNAILNMELHAVGGEEYGYFYGTKVMGEYILDLLDKPGLVTMRLKDGED